MEPNLNDTEVIVDGDGEVLGVVSHFFRSSEDKHRMVVLSEETDTWEESDDVDLMALTNNFGIPVPPNKVEDLAQFFIDAGFENGNNDESGLFHLTDLADFTDYDPKEGNLFWQESN